MKLFGIDLGVTHFAALSNGECIAHPRYLRQAEKKLAAAQQALARKKRGSHRRKKAVQRVAKCHRKIANQRKDFQHKASRKLVNQYQVIVFEDVQVKNLTKAPAPKQDEETGTSLPNGAAAVAFSIVSTIIRSHSRVPRNGPSPFNDTGKSG